MRKSDHRLKIILLCLFIVIFFPSINSYNTMYLINTQSIHGIGTQLFVQTVRFQQYFFSLSASHCGNLFLVSRCLQDSLRLSSCVFIFIYSLSIQPETRYIIFFHQGIWGNSVVPVKHEEAKTLRRIKKIVSNVNSL